jgi:zinc protease
VNSAGSAGARLAWIAVLIGLLTLTGPHASRAGPGAMDPDLRAGVLPNGMNFLILRHAPDRHEVSLRLRIAAGSLQEPKGQDGVAHMLEHMAFRGSTHVPESEIWRRLQRLGVAFGADSNAFTTTRQTYYQFDLPEADAASVDTGLSLMREIASELTLGSMAVNDERPVVLAEARLTDNPSLAADRAQTAFWFADQPPFAHDAMGDLDVIAQLDERPLRAYYDAFYRPERATILVVGDVDPASTEAAIRARFSDWIGQGTAGADPVLNPVATRPRASVFVQPGAPSAIRLAWITPKPTGATSARRRLLAELAIRILDRRLAEASNVALSATATQQSRPPLGDITLLNLDCPPGEWRAGLAMVEAVRRRILRDGVTGAEIARERDAILNGLETAAAAAASRPSAALANAIIARIDADQPLTTAAQDLTSAQAAYAGLTVADLDAALRGLFEGAGPLIFLSSPEAVDEDGAAVLDAYAAIEARPLSSNDRPTTSATPAWPYARFGPPGVVVERREIADLGVFFIRFENGVTLTVHPSRSGDGQVLAQVAVGGGRLELPRDRKTVIWAADSGVFDAGGLKAIDRDALRRALGASVFSFAFSTGDDSFNLTGVTRPADLEVQMQVLTAYATAPGWRPAAFEHVRALFVALLPQFEASPGGVLGDDFAGLLHDGDPRWTTPTLGDVVASRPRDLRDVLERPLARGPIEVTIVGDIDVDHAVEAVAATLGALPSRPTSARPAPAAYVTRFPAPTGTPVIRYHGGHADQAMALIAWPTNDAFAAAPKLADLRVLQQVLNNRLIERLRIADGATYTPRTGLEASRTFPGFGYLYASASESPARTGEVLSRVDEIAADLGAREISSDELERARRPAIAAMVRAQQTDAYWLTALSHAQDDPRRLDLIRGALPGLRAVTAADIREAAATCLRDDRAWKLIIAPHGQDVR